MSQLDAFAAHVRGPDFSMDTERFSWLQDQLSEIATNFVHPVDPMQEMLAHYSVEVARRNGTDRAAGWIIAARTLREALPDPDEMFYGILIASEAWGLELRYSLDDMARFLRGLRDIPNSVEDTTDDAQNAAQLYEHLLNRIQDIDTMLDRELDDGENVLSEWSQNPETIPNALELLDRVCADFTGEVERFEKREVEIEELNEFIEESGLLLRASFRAEQAGVSQKELTTFVLAFPNDWVEMTEDLARDRSLAPGTLAALVNADSHPIVPKDSVAATGCELVTAFREIPVPPYSLLEYLVNCLSAVEQDA